MYIVHFLYWLYTQWCGNSQSCRTLSNKFSECPVIETTLYTKYMETRAIKIGQKCLVVCSMFPNPCLSMYMYVYVLFELSYMYTCKSQQTPVSVKGCHSLIY